MSLNKEKVIEGEIAFERRMTYQEGALGFAELIVCVDENRQHRFKCFQTSEEAPASSPQPCYVMPDVSVCALDDMRIAFVVHITLMRSPEDHIKIHQASIGIVVFRMQRPVYHPLYVRCTNRVIHLKRHDLTRLPAYHRHNIRVYPVFMSFSAVSVPEYFVQFKCFKFRRWTYPQILAPFLLPPAPSGMHLICSCSVSYPPLCLYSPTQEVEALVFSLLLHTL